MKRGGPALIAALALAAAAGPAAGQTPPLRTIDPVPVEAGRAVASAGAEYQRGRAYPLSGLTGDLVGLPVVALTFGFGRADFRVESGYDVLWVDRRDPAAPFAHMVEIDGDVTHDVRDPVISTRVLLRHETRHQPAVGVRVSTKLPSTSNSSGYCRASAISGSRRRRRVRVSWMAS